LPHRKSPARLRKATRIQAFRAFTHRNTKLPGTLTPQSLGDMEAALTGYVVLPGDPDYDKDRQETNPAFQKYPQMIVYCMNENDVAICIQYAKLAELWVTTRSGGHSTGGYSVNDGMVIDVSNINDVFIDAERKLVFAGAGCNWDKFNGALKNTGWHVPTGACGGVCVAGFVQGGGYGYTSRAYGMQSDCVNSFRVMLASGEIVMATANDNADLFWALRGGTGGNFGIVLQVAYNMVWLPSVWAWAISWDYTYASQALALMQTNYMKTGCPDQVGYMMNIGFQSGVPVYMVQGMYAGSRADGLRAIKSLLSIPSAQLLVDEVGSYPAMDNYLEDHPYSLPDQPDGTPESKASCYIDKPMSQSDWQRVIDYVKISPNAWSLAYTEPYGGAINRVPIDESAFVHRNADFDFVVDVFWRDAKEQKVMLSWLDGLMSIVRPFSNGHIYQNYPDPRLANWSTPYFGGAYPRLQQVKAKYDPESFFVYAQSIVPSAA
jgi:FAD binding domain/Berberine and berberine like